MASVINQVDESKSLSETRQMSGRRVIKSSAKQVTDDNVWDILDKALGTHYLNASETDYLWKYYCGNQPIWYRQKTVRPEICNKIVVNRANEIVSFKVGYLCGEPIQYVGRTGDTAVTEAIQKLNEYMFSEDKAAQDEELVEWQMICGTGYRLVLPDSEVGSPDDAPFEMYTLDPRQTFVVYSTDVGSKPLMAVVYSQDDDSVTHYSIYSENHFWEFEDGIMKASRPHALGMIPIFEYPANHARLGSFEIVLPLLDALNKTESNRLDGVEQFIQSFMKFINCDIDEDTFAALKEMGAIKITSRDGQKADVEIITSELNQNETQTLSDNLYDTILTICGMPNSKKGSSTSDTGAAVLLRDGWSLAEARAKDSEHMFKRAEKKMLKLVLRICRDLVDMDLKLGDIKLQFTRRNYEAIQSKSQVLISMLNQSKIHPLLAFESSGLFVDPEAAYTLSMKHWEEEQERLKVEGLGQNAVSEDDMGLE